jgi:signal transduction histidine kinase/ActR/RegA family two-component response regulator
MRADDQLIWPRSSVDTAEIRQTRRGQEGVGAKELDVTVGQRAGGDASWWLVRRAPSAVLATLLFLAAVLAATTDEVVFWFHVTFALLTISSLFLDFRTVASQAIVWVPVTVIIVIAAVSAERTQTSELAELPFLTASLGAVLVVSHLRSKALTDLRRAQVTLESQHRHERERLEQRLAHAQAADVVGRLTAGVAHDLSNVLTAILGHAEELTESVDDTSKAHAEAIEAAVQGAIALIDDLTSLSRGDHGRPVDVVDVNAVVTTVLEMLKPLLGDHVRVALDVRAAPCTVRSHWSRVERIVVNLVVNAREAIDTSGELTVSTDVVDLTTSRGELDAGRYVVLAVADTGSGVDAENIDRVFDPFFSTKERTGSVGIGLSTVRDIARHAGGAVEIESGDNGTVVYVHLPFVAESPGAVDPDEGPRSEGTETVLVVEDDEHVRHRIQAALARHGYHVLEAATAEAALSLSEEYAGPIDLLLSDVMLPGMHGPELAQRLRLTRPSVMALLMSGYSDAGAVDAAVVLRKPIRRKDLLTAVRSALDDQLTPPGSSDPDGGRTDHH